MRFRIQNTEVLLFAALYGYKKWFLTLREVHKLQAFETRQAIYVKRNIEARSCDNCSNGKAVCITYSESVSVALGIQHLIHMSHIVICRLPGSRISFHII
jgi:hypothetical protein